MNIGIDNLLSHTGDVALRRRAKWILQKVELKKPKSILDVGCGDGFYLHLFSSLFPKTKLVGIDFDINALNSAKNNLKGKNIHLKLGDVNKLEFKNNSFDVVLASEVLEHLKNDAKGIREIFRVLKPNGLFVVSVPHSNYPFFWDPINWILERLFNIHIKNGFWAGIWNQHERLYSKDQLKILLKKSGFKDVESDILTHICLPFNHHFLNIFARILASNHISLKKSSINKFNVVKKEKSFSPFLLIFGVDIFNEIFKSDKIGVSVVASAVKI